MKTDYQRGVADGFAAAVESAARIECVACRRDVPRTEAGQHREASGFISPCFASRIRSLSPPETVAAGVTASRWKCPECGWYEGHDQACATRRWPTVIENEQQWAEYERLGRTTGRAAPPVDAPAATCDHHVAIVNGVCCSCGADCRALVNLPPAAEREHTADMVDAILGPLGVHVDRDKMRAESVATPSARTGDRREKQLAKTRAAIDAGYPHADADPNAPSKRKASARTGGECETCSCDFCGHQESVHGVAGCRVAGCGCLEFERRR